MVYTADDKAEIAQILRKLGLNKKDDGGTYAQLRQNRGRLLTRRKVGNGTRIEIVADGRADWIGWVELKNERTNEKATQHTAQVINDVNADVPGVIEADKQPSLSKFQSILLRAIEGTPYPHVMLIDGNDDRGIDVGLLTKDDYEIVRIRSHIDDRDADGIVFSRDCPEYTITTPTGQRLVVLVNHFKSKGYGSKTAEKRKRQATRVTKIYADLIAEGEANIVVLGDLNDTPDSDALAPLLAETDLKDITTNDNFTSDGRAGTYKNGTKGQKIKRPCGHLRGHQPLGPLCDSALVVRAQRVRLEDDLNAQAAPFTYLAVRERHARACRTASVPRAWLPVQPPAAQTPRGRRVGSVLVEGGDRPVPAHLPAQQTALLVARHPRVSSAGAQLTQGHRSAICAPQPPRTSRVAHGDPIRQGLRLGAASPAPATPRRSALQQRPRSCPDHSGHRRAQRRRSL